MHVQSLIAVLEGKKILHLEADVGRLWAGRWRGFELLYQRRRSFQISFIVTYIRLSFRTPSRFSMRKFHRDLSKAKVRDRLSSHSVVVDVTILPSISLLILILSFRDLVIPRLQILPSLPLAIPGGSQYNCLNVNSLLTSMPLNHI